MCRPEKRAHTRVRPYKHLVYYFWDTILVAVIEVTECSRRLQPAPWARQAMPLQ